MVSYLTGPWAPRYHSLLAQEGNNWEDLRPWWVQPSFFCSDFRCDWGRYLEPHHPRIRWPKGGPGLLMHISIESCAIFKGGEWITLGRCLFIPRRGCRQLPLKSKSRIYSHTQLLMTVTAWKARNAERQWHFSMLFSWLLTSILTWNSESHRIHCGKHMLGAYATQKKCGH